MLPALAGRSQAGQPIRLLTASRSLELSNKAYSLYVRQNPAEQGEFAEIGAFELQD